MADQGNRQGQGSGVKGQGYRQLLAWQRAHELALAVYKQTQPLAPRDNWLRTQVNRSALSVGANIAEGYSRGSLREYLQFLSVARGSLAETEYHLLFIRDAGLITPGAHAELDAIRREAANLLLGLIRSLQAKAETTPRGDRRISDGRGDYAAVPDTNGSLTLDP